MADEQWQKVREIFDAALRQPPEVRPNYLVEACGEDAALLAEVESLFSSYDKSEDFLKQPAVTAVADLIEAEIKQPKCGQRFGHYEITKHLGAGGMGEVYLARDTKLDRQVAVKFLNDKHSEDPANLERFVREAKAASALNHPNILVIHEIGASDEAQYIVSEYVTGETLRRVLADKTLPLTEVLDIAIQIANALAAAHEARLVHRDIKPENVMLRPDGLVKILDFGLAKLLARKNKSVLGLGDSTAQESQTAKGMILGTVNYMSPEQAKGERIDERTDIFSFGVMLYEMLAGRTPFAGASVSETFANVINAEPPPLAWFVKQVPDELQRLVAKTLRKDRDARYQTMKGLLADLKELRGNLASEAKLERGPAASNPQATTVLQAATGDAPQTTAATQGSSISIIISQHKPLAAIALVALLIGVLGPGYYLLFARHKAVANAGGKKHIAILPVQPLTAENRDVIYEFGIADSLTLKLSAAKNLIVRPLSTTRQYADITQDALAAGREMQVDYVLASNYQIADGKIRVTSQLFNVAKGQAEETYKSEKDAGNIFAAEDAIAGEVGNKLLARFATTSSSPVVKRGTNNEEAYGLYLQGRYLTMQVNARDQKKAIERFEQAIKLDPNYALAYARMANAYIWLDVLDDVVPRAEKIREIINKAFELDNNLAAAYVARGQLSLVFEWNLPAAEKDLLRAIELEPNNDTAHWLYALLLAARKQFDEALISIETAQSIDPSAGRYMMHRGRILYYARRYDEAVVQFERLMEWGENFSNWSLFAYQMKGDETKAYEIFMKVQERRKSDHLEVYRKTYETAGWQGVMRKTLEFAKLDEQEFPGGAFHIAKEYALLGEKDQAFEYLNKAVEKRRWFIYTLNVEPAFDNLRGDPRFDELVTAQEFDERGRTVGNARGAQGLQ